MRAMRVAITVVFVTFSPICAAGEVPYEPSMVLIEGGSYPVRLITASSSSHHAHVRTDDARPVRFGEVWPEYLVASVAQFVTAAYMSSYLKSTTSDFHGILTL